MHRAEGAAEQAAELRLRGLTYEKIGREMGMTPEGARQAVIRGLDRIRGHTDELAVEVRAQEAARLDRICETLSRLADDAADEATALAVIDRLLKVQDRRARLLGLDLQRVELTGANGGPIQIAAIQRVIVDPQQNPVVDVAPSSTPSTPHAIDAPSTPLALPSPETENASNIKDLGFSAMESMPLATD